MAREDCADFDIGSSEGEADEIGRVGLNQMFGNRIVFCHVDTTK